MMKILVVLALSFLALCFAHSITDVSFKLGVPQLPTFYSNFSNYNYHHASTLQQQQQPYFTQQTTHTDQPGRRFHVAFVAAPFRSHVNVIFAIAAALAKRSNMFVTFHGQDYVGKWIQEENFYQPPIPVLFREMGNRSFDAELDEYTRLSLEEPAKAGGALQNVLELMTTYSYPLLSAHFVNERPDLLVADPYALYAETLADYLNLPMIHASNVPLFWSRFVSSSPYVPAAMFPISQRLQMNRLPYRLLNFILTQIVRFVGEPPIKADVNNFRTKLGLPSSSSLDGDRHPSLIAIPLGFEYPRPLSPMIHFIGHTRDYESLLKYRPVIGELREWLDSSPLPVLYVATGTVVVFRANFVQKMAETVFHVASSGRWRVLWSLKAKFASSIHNIDFNPRLVKILDHVPQVAVLMENVVKSFWTHGGSSSLLEAAHTSKPVVCTPFFADQPGNCFKSFDAGYGLVMQVGEVCGKTLLSLVDNQLNDKSFKENAIRVGLLSRTAGGSSRGADLIEQYVMTGYNHLISFDVKALNWVQRYNIDIFLSVIILVPFTICTLCCLIYFVGKFFRTILRAFFNL